MMINNPLSSEYDYMVDLALNILMDYETYNFPLDIDNLATKMGINIKKYSSLKEYEKLYQKSPLGMTILSQYDKKHYEFDTYYNDYDTSTGRHRFTLAHEIGHIANGDIGKSLTKKEELLYDYFAKCLLAPQCIIILNKEFDEETITTKYNVSKPVAKNWLQAINNRVSVFGIDCFTNTEKTYIEEMKKYHNH